MAANFLIRQTSQGWELTVERARKGLVHCDDRDVAVNIGMAAARRCGVVLIMNEDEDDAPHGLTPLAA
ncbi:hypothetical protein [Cupriavidus taiwanensis]|uniref:hypothetical protein n=1 Tax=Cupriavidus taiwanensis TaxID=164546 RepID=UPI000E11A2A0|nr:hypothetical protein [Cupriavidus taiwanensis]SPC16674.1 conserved hypothetical protein [Cupriavidus taiwanensis]